jgi:hypothetical protein
MSVVYSRKKRNPDRTIRVYLSLDCNGGCEYCSAGVPGASREVRDRTILPEIWAEGINRRGRECILAGGEPFLYPQLAELVNMLRVRSQIYTNLKCDVNGFLSIVRRPVAILASCHPMNSTERQAWLQNAHALIEARHHLRFHIVKSEGWRERLDFIRDNGIEARITACDDQRGGIKSSGQETNDLMPSVNCRHRIYLYGPGGYRYPCVTLMVRGNTLSRYEHISESDSNDWTEVTGCQLFGYCVGCDNNIEGEVRG